MTRDLFRLMRPHHWIKNTFVLAPLLFARKLTDPSALVHAVAAFFAFSFGASAVYVMNDILDAPQDRLHPAKRNRPLAAGRVSTTAAWLLSGTLAFLALAPSRRLLPGLFCRWLLLYMLVNVCYSFVLKRVVIIDVMLVALGFVLRVLGGAAAIGVEASSWLLMCTYLLALFLGFGKRRHELVMLERGEDHREVLRNYGTYFLDQMIAVVTASTTISYALYTISDQTCTKFGGDRLGYTVPFVLYGIFRYLYLVHQQDRGGDPTTLLLCDVPLLTDVLLWVIFVFILIYM